MFIPKFNIYETEWLDMVFHDRNKSYGAYDLRKHYSQTLLKAMAVAGVFLLSVALLAFILFKPATSIPITAKPTVDVNLTKQIYVMPDKIRAIALMHRRIANPIVHRATHGNTQPALGNTVTYNQPVNVIQTTGTPVKIIIPAAQTALPAEDIIVEAPDVMPQPVGGESAWTNFLQQNLKYPLIAGQKGISGKVWLSFIVEKDGHLSDIELTAPASNGFDEEALRVLKLAPVWKPGLQNGQPVRVRYTLPVNFQIVK